MSNKCAVVDKILNPCPGLDRAIGGSYEDRCKGVVLLELRNLGSDTFTVTRSAAVLRSGDLGKNGVIMNYCPFCGASIAEHMHGKVEVTA